VLEQELPAGVDTESDLERVREVYARGNLPL
jgi:3-deoxy-manno-octulosonate cytidylyltransferase (CMP-KDO synthetase)